MRQDLEHQEQVALFKWAEIQANRTPELRLLFAVPNWAGVKGPREGARRKAEGVKAGVPDVCLPIARGGFHGLFIEMKSETGSATKEQKRWMQDLNKQGYAVRLCRGFQEGRAALEEYLGIGSSLLGGG